MFSSYLLSSFISLPDIQSSIIFYADVVRWCLLNPPVTPALRPEIVIQRMVCRHIFGWRMLFIRVITREYLEREQCKQQRLLQKKQTRIQVSVQDIVNQPVRNLELSRIVQLNQSEWAT